jgi:lactate dehydrogenase-like 2-hydroxyacid dehydrogenase
VLTHATAELALTLLLMAARRAGEGERELRAGAWQGWRPTHMLGRSLAGRHLALVGFGRIAQAFAGMARSAFGMTISYHGRRRAGEAEERALEARYWQDLAEMAAAATSSRCIAQAARRRAISSMQPCWGGWDRIPS